MAVVRRIAFGRLCAHESAPTDVVSEAFKAADWTPSTSQTVSRTTTGLLRVTGNGSSRCVRYTALAGRVDAYVQAIWAARSDGGTCGIAARISSEAIPLSRIQMIAASGFVGNRTLAEVDGGSLIQQDADGSVNDTLPERHSLWVRGDLADGYAHDPAVAYALTGVAMQDAGEVGVFHSGGANSAVTRDWSAFFAMTSAIVTVLGPSADDWYAEIRSGADALLADATPSGGTAAIDLFAARVLFPDAVKVQIRAVSDDSLLAEYSPKERVWGGDSYAYLPDELAPSGEIERTALGRLAAYQQTPIANVSVAHDAGHWTGPSGIAVSLDGTRLRLTHSAVSATRCTPLTNLADRADVFLQVLQEGDAAAVRAGLYARGTNEALPVDMIYARAPNSSSSAGNRNIQLGEFTASANVQVAQTGEFQTPFPNRYSLDVAGAVARWRVHGARTHLALAGIALVGADAFGILTSHDTGSGTSTHDFDDVFVMTSALLVVTGTTEKPWRAQLLNSSDVVIAEADAVAGVATIDCYEWQVRFPECTQIRILDMTSYESLALAAPAERLWGGDAWEWAEAVETGGALAFGATFAATPTVENPAPEFRPCTAVLEVFADDGETVAFTVTTDPATDRPYLMPPDNYGAREIDPVSGAASIGTVDVSIVDPAQTAGDQDSGWITERLDLIFGRRCRLRRYVSILEGFYTIADGPASAPRMNGDYASFSFSIRDTREGERRLRPFSGGGTTALVPFGPLEDWGTDPADDSPLLDAVTPLIGRSLIVFNSTANKYVGLIQLNDYFDFLSVPGTIFMDPAVQISEDAIGALKSVNFGELSGYPTADVLWRIAGSGDPWNVARPAPPALYGNNNLAGIQPGLLEGTTTQANGIINVTVFWADAAIAGFPEEDDTELEVIIRHRGAPTEEIPYYYEGPLGTLLAAMYDRSLERAPDLGGELHDPLGLDDVPTTFFGGGVRVDAAALAALDTPMLLRQTEPVDDGRDWAESALYAPSGFIPSLDAEGRISPVSRARPQTITGPLIHDAITEPAPEWNAGERVVTVVRYNYLRYFKPTFTQLTEVGTDGLAVREVTLEFRDPAAIDRHGEEVEEFDASAFGAVGNASGLAIDGVPEVPAVLGSAARYEVLERYRDGAQAIVVKVRRSQVPGLRDGTFVPVQLSWHPNFATGRRGMDLAAAQVLSLENLDCEWLGLLIEEVPVAAAPGYFTLLDKVEDTPDPGFYSDLEMVSDEEGGS